MVAPKPQTKLEERFKKFQENVIKPNASDDNQITIAMKAAYFLGAADTFDIIHENQDEVQGIMDFVRQMNAEEKYVTDYVRGQLISDLRSYLQGGDNGDNP